MLAAQAAHQLARQQHRELGVGTGQALEGAAVQAHQQAVAHGQHAGAARLGGEEGEKQPFDVTADCVET